jgi:hypothetical protein
MAPRPPTGARTSLPSRIAGGAARAAPYAQGAVAVIGTLLAAREAVDLYNNRGRMASRFQDEVVFPSDLVQSNRDFYISFGFQKYVKRSIVNPAELSYEGTVRLPIPSNLSDTLSQTYGTESLGPMVGAALEGASQGGPATGSATAGEALANFASNVPNVLGGAISGGALKAAQDFSSDEFGRAVSAYTGLAANPYQTILYKNPNFKKHSFTWRLTPKDEDESARIRNLVRIFQYHSSPGISEAGYGLFFSYPSMVMIQLFPQTEFLYKFKPCVVEKVSVNYAASSSPSFFKRTNAPTSVIFSIDLTEIEYWTNKDYENTMLTSNLF